MKRLRKKDLKVGGLYSDFHGAYRYIAKFVDTGLRYLQIYPESTFQKVMPTAQQLGYDFCGYHNTLESFLRAVKEEATSEEYNQYSGLIAEIEKEIPNRDKLLREDAEKFCNEVGQAGNTQLVNWIVNGHYILPSHNRPIPTGK
jgi:hypothetical protein